MRLLCAVCLVFLASVQAEYRCKDYEGADIRGRLEEGMRLMKLGELKRAEGCMVGALRDAERGRGTTQADEAMTPAVCNTGELYKKMGNCERGLPLLLHCVDRLASTATSLTAMLAANPNDEHTNQLRIILEQRALNFFHAGDTLRKLNATRKQLTTLFKDRQEGLYTDIHNVLSERLIFRRGKSLNRADIHNAAGEASAVLYKEAAVQFSEIVAKRFSKASVKNARYGLGVAHHNIGAALTENLPAKAVDAYREAIRHAPTQGESYTNLAQLTKGIEPDKAYTLFKSGFERAPENAECRNKYFTYVMAEYKTEDACREVSAHSDSFTERETLQFAECLLLPLNEPARGFKTLKRAVRAVVGRGDETEIHTAADIVYNTATALMARSDLRSYATKTFDVSLDMMMCNTHLEALQDGSAERGERAASCAYGLNNKGIVQERAGDMVSARHSYEFALLFLPSFARAKTNLAGIMRSEDSDVAESLLLEVLADEPSFGEAANNLANIYATSRRLENAAPLYAKAAEALSSFDTILNFAHTLKRICAWGTLHATLLQLKRKISANSTDGSTVADTPRVLHLLSLYGTQFLSVRSLSTPQSWGSVASIPLVTHMTILRQGALTADSQHLVQQVRTHRDTPDKGIALVASDFRRHPVGYALLALEGSGLACFHVGDAGEDELTDVLSLGCTSYSQHLGNGRRQEEVLLEVEEGTQYVLHHAVLVDVNGNTEGGAERLFTAIDSARRGGEQSFYLYPTLVAFLGYPESYGLQYDYFLSDVHTLPPSSVHPKISRGGVRTEFFFEHIVYLCPAALSGSALQRYTTEGADATEEAAEVSDSVEAFLSEHPDLPDRQSRLCYTGQHYKITPTIFSVWTAVLSRAPNTVLLLPEWEGTLRLKEEASSRGVLHQIITLPFLDYALYRQFHASLCGLSLDTDVYSGHMSAMDALISGTPLLTLPGGNARSRMASSLVRTMRKDSDIFVAGSYREYEDTAVRFVTQTAEEYAVVQEKGVFTEEEMAAAGEQYRHSAEQGLAMVARLRLMKEKSHIIPQDAYTIMAPKPQPKKDAVLDPEPGADCLFYEGEEHAWTPGKVVSWDGKFASCQSNANTNPKFTWENGSVVEKLKPEDVYMVNRDILEEDVQDLLSLTVLHDSTLLNVLRMRYFQNYIYTNIGAITVALNPFNFKIPWYTDDNMPKYLAEGDRIETQIPHSWATAHNTYFEMMTADHDPYNQCILVSGESGAGKTEASKIVMKYLAAISCKSGTEAQKAAAIAVGTNINITSAPLEAFGNARTSRNDNSSRFGKWMKVKFDTDGFLVGAHITKYLLEKSRIVTAQAGERVYHSFYLICRANEKKNWDIGGDGEYSNTSAGGQSSNKEFDTPDEFTEVWKNLLELGVDVETLDSIWRVVAGVMDLENVDFDVDGEGSKISSKSSGWVDKCQKQWQISLEDLKRELVITTMVTRDGEIPVPLNPTKARDGRSALTKSLYDHEFSWVIEKCNKSLDVDTEGRWIGLLDIFGFEDFEYNSFEQLCINLANESLQNHYNAYIFERDMDECRAEGIDVTQVEFPDNTPCLRMMVFKGGIFALLDEECSLGKGSPETFLSKITDYCQGEKSYEPFFTRDRLATTSFIIHHYAGSVSYEVGEFLDKNRDTLKPAFKHMMRASSNSFIADLIDEPEENAQKITVGGFFKTQVADLMALINSTNPHWIRCVKPHPAKAPLNFHGVKTMQQLASSGVLGTVRIRKAGFPVRIPFEQFTEKYNIISSAGSDPASIIKASGIDPMTAQVGKTRVFLKSDSYVELEKLKKAALLKHSQTVQAHARAYLAIIQLKQTVYDANKAVVDKLREEIREQMREERERREREDGDRLAAERAAMEGIADALANIGADCDADGAALLKEEDRRWNEMMEEFQVMSEIIELERIEEEARAEREREEKIAAEARKKEDAAVAIQSLFRGYNTRGLLIRQFAERARAGVEFDQDASLFYQHMLMLQLDTNRLEMEASVRRAERALLEAQEREQQWEEKERRRAEQLLTVQERKTEAALLEQRMEEEVTEEAIREARRLRNERALGEQARLRQRREENKVRRARVQALQHEATAARQRRRREMEEQAMHAEHRVALTEQAFHDTAAAHLADGSQRRTATAAFQNGQGAYHSREQIQHEPESLRPDIHPFHNPPDPRRDALSALPQPSPSTPY